MSVSREINSSGDGCGHFQTTTLESISEHQRDSNGTESLYRRNIMTRNEKMVCHISTNG